MAPPRGAGVRDTRAGRPQRGRGTGNWPSSSPGATPPSRPQPGSPSSARRPWHPGAGCGCGAPPAGPRPPHPAVLGFALAVVPLRPASWREPTDFPALGNVPPLDLVIFGGRESLKVGCFSFPELRDGPPPPRKSGSVIASSQGSKCLEIANGSEACGPYGGIRPGGQTLITMVTSVQREEDPDWIRLLVPSTPRGLPHCTEPKW
ncbi:cleavage and polyadenylation specificity factor subunit 6-like [Vulpes lagopus]|uniref:cleavage and polyadenylation specificity factor subunit 6-like n=1 Tax=Vulpes lagopus TaxID=494514 RepID=UPI001BCA2991|nr:cleavage and polyadenylation specificity factor subunit 6-like [Vulpes lagopus]